MPKIQLGRKAKILVLVLIVAAIAAAGALYASHHFSNSDKQKATTPPAASKKPDNKPHFATSQTVVSDPKQLTAPDTPDRALMTVQVMYVQYMVATNTARSQPGADPNTGTSVQAAGLAAIKNNLSDTFYRSVAQPVAGKDAITCTTAQQSDFNGGKVESSNAASAKISLPINGDASKRVVVTEDLASHKITNITCP